MIADVNNPDDRLFNSIRQLIQLELDKYRFAGTYDYSIQAIYGTEPDITIDAVPVNQACGLPNLFKLAPQREIAGITGIPTVGSHCRVIFLNRDPTMPRVYGWDAIGNIPLARLGDRVSVFMPPQIQVLAGFSFNPAINGFTGNIMLLNQNVDAFITVGSPTDFSG